jgi:regulator of protease activity HflC (stomatin/prohibitin superfamily)
MIRFIKTGTTGIIQTFGKYTRMTPPGITFYFPFVQTVTPVSNMIHSLNMEISGRTKDKAFPKVAVDIQYQIDPELTAVAYFSRANPIGDMQDYINDTVRTKVSNLTLDALYESQTDIAGAIMSQVGPSLQVTGYTLIKVLVSGITPPEAVLTAMNDINASERRLVVARNEGEATKIQKVMEAEADAIRKELQGKGLARMREAIMTGWTESVSKMSAELGMNAADVTAFITKMSHLDTVGEIGRGKGTRTIFLNHGPDDRPVGQASTDLSTSIMQAIEGSRKN